MTSRNHRQGGFSLIELMVAATVMVIVIGMASLTLLTQYRGLQSSDLSRVANGENRTAILELESSLRRLGFGINPPDALDLTLDCRGGTLCRDSATSPDELSFVARDPYYLWTAEDDLEPDGTKCTTSGGCFGGGNIWPITADVANHKVHVALPSGTTLRRGQIVLATCASGVSGVMLRLNADLVGNGTAQDVPTASADTVPYNVPSQIVDCHNATGAALFLVDRYHYFIQTIGSTPWLMLDTGIDLDGDGTLPPGDTDDLIPVAPDVEDMQVAYVYNSDPDHPVTVVGDTAGTAEEPSRSDPAPAYDTATSDDLRFNKNPANVRGIRVTLRLRSSAPDPMHKGQAWTNMTTTSALTFENEQVNIPTDGYRRYTAETEIRTENLEARLPFFF